MLPLNTLIRRITFSMVDIDKYLKLEFVSPFVLHVSISELR